MNNKDGILDKIISVSEAQIAENIAEGNAKADEIISKANKESKDSLDKFNSTTTATYNEVVRRIVSVANLDAKKVLMGAKRAAMDTLFADTLVSAFEMDDKSYLKIIASMINTNAKSGNEIIISEADSKRITKKFVDDIAKAMDIKLSIAKEFGDFKGGIIIAGKSYDTNLTFEVELSAIRSDSETELASKIFKE